MNSQEIDKVCMRNKGIVTRKQLTKRRMYAQLLKKVHNGDLVRLKAGVFAQAETLASPIVDIRKIVPDGILCLYSAWSYYELTTQIPSSICVAIKRGRKVVLPDFPDISLYRFTDSILKIGITKARIGGLSLPIYDLERSVCDALRYRNKIGIETSSEIIRNYLSRKDRDLAKLHLYAKSLRVNNLLSTYLEIAI